MSREIRIWLAAALLALIGAAQACANPPKLTDVASDVGKASKLVVPMSKDALKLLHAERDHLAASDVLTGEKLAGVDTGLTYADTVLARVERKEKVTREELLKAIDAASLVNELLVAAGAKPPPLVASAIDVARRVVDEAK